MNISNCFTPTLISLERSYTLIINTEKTLSENCGFCSILPDYYSYCVDELGSKVPVSIWWGTGAVCPRRPVSILCVKFISIPFNEFAFQFYIQLGEGPQFVIAKHRHLAGQRLLECKAQSSDICLSDNMFCLTADSDAYRIPSTGTPLHTIPAFLQSDEATMLSR